MKKQIISLSIAAGLFLSVNNVEAAQNVNINTSVFTNENVRLIVKNNYSFEIAATETPQILKNGKWIDLDFYTVNFVNPNKSAKYLTPIKNNFKKGTYRYKVEVEKFDKKGNAVKIGETFSKSFKIN